MLDPISDMLTRIRNAQMAGHPEVLCPASKLKFAIAQILQKEAFIASVTKEKDGGKDLLRIHLRYDHESDAYGGGVGVITGIHRVSKQGQRRYIKRNEVHVVKNEYGVSVISTSQGVMTNREARKRGLGGEVI